MGRRKSNLHRGNQVHCEFVWTGRDETKPFATYHRLALNGVAVSNDGREGAPGAPGVQGALLLDKGIRFVSFCAPYIVGKGEGVQTWPLNTKRESWRCRVT